MYFNFSIQITPLNNSDIIEYRDPASFECLETRDSTANSRHNHQVGRPSGALQHRQTKKPSSTPRLIVD